MNYESLRVCHAEVQPVPIFHRESISLEEIPPIVGMTKPGGITTRA